MGDIPALHVAQVSAYPPSKVSGINRVITTIALKLADTGITFTLLSPDDGTRLPNVASFPLRVRWSAARNLELAIRTFSALVGRKLLVGMVHAHQPHLQSLASLLAAKIIGIPSIITFHVRPPERGVVAVGIGSLLAMLATKLASVSVSVSQRIATDFGVAHPRVIPNGVDVPELTPDLQEYSGRSDELELVFAGRVTSTKGSLVLLEALAKSKTRLPGVRLKTFGPIDDPHSYNETKARLGIESLVDDRGYDGNWHRYLGARQVFVLPSYYEGVPLALLEAMARGLIVITTPVGGVPEVVTDGITGLIVPVGDAARLADALVWVGHNRPAAANMGLMGRRLIQSKFSATTMAEAYRDLYFAVRTGRI